MSPATERKVLIGLVVGLVVVALYQFVTRYEGGGGDEGPDPRAEYEELLTRISRAEALIASEDALRRRGEEARRDLVEAASRHLPDPDPLRFLFWAHRTIYPVARQVGLHVDWVNDDRPVVLGDPHPRDFQINRVRIRAAGSLETLRRFLAALEESNPHAAVSQITVTAQVGDPLNHLITIVVDWPAWSDREEGMAYMEEEASP